MRTICKQSVRYHPVDFKLKILKHTKFQCKYVYLYIFRVRYSHEIIVELITYLHLCVPLMFASFLYSGHMKKIQTIGQNVKSILIERPFCSIWKRKRVRSDFGMVFLYYKQQRVL